METADNYDRDSNGKGAYANSSLRFGRRRKPRPPSDLRFSHQDTEMLRQFISEYGRIVPRRISRLSARQQRDLARQVKRARILGTLPFDRDHS